MERQRQKKESGLKDEYEIWKMNKYWDEQVKLLLFSLIFLIKFQRLRKSY